MCLPLPYTYTRHKLYLRSDKAWITWDSKGYVSTLFKYKTDNICRKGELKLNVLARLPGDLNVECKLLLFFSFILSHSKYCSLIWHLGNRDKTMKMNNKFVLIENQHVWRLPRDFQETRSGMSCALHKAWHRLWQIDACVPRYPILMHSGPCLSGHSQERPPSLMCPQSYECIWFSLLPKTTSLMWPQFSWQIGWPY